MMGAENTAVLKDWADEVRKVETQLRELTAGRDTAIRHALTFAKVADVRRATGLSRERIYQIRDAG